MLPADKFVVTTQHRLDKSLYRLDRYGAGRRLLACRDKQRFVPFDNQGQNWTKLTAGIPERVVALTFTASGTKLLAGTVNGFFVSGDNGASWQQLNGGLLNLQVGALAVKGNLVLAGTRSGGVFTSQLPQ